MPEKVLLISDSFPPDFGGVARHVYTLSQFLAEKNYDVTVITPSIKIEKNEIVTPENIDVKRNLKFLRKTNPLQWPYILIHNSNVLRRTINELGSDFDYIHYHGSNTLFLNNINIQRPFTLTLHGIFPACIFFQEIDTWCRKNPSTIRCSLCVAGIRKKYYPLLPGMILYSSYYYSNMNKSMRTLKKIISVSDYVKNIVESAFNLNNIITLYNFIDIKNDIKFNLNKEGEKIKIKNKEEKTILYSGGLKYSKGIDTLLESYKLLNNDGSIKLVVSGIGPYEEKIKKHMLKDKNVIYLGYLSRSDQMKVLNETDVFLAPSIYPDACPTSILEAMALGIPVIATKVGGIPELMDDGKTGYLVDPNDPQQIREKILTVFSKGPNYYYQHCIERAESFDNNAIGPKIVELYKSLN